MSGSNRAGMSLELSRVSCVPWRTNTSADFEAGLLFAVRILVVSVRFHWTQPEWRARYIHDRDVSALFLVYAYRQIEALAQELLELLPQIRFVEVLK
jgi:hypothetical protein